MTDAKWRQNICQKKTTGILRYHLWKLKLGTKYSHIFLDELTPQLPVILQCKAIQTEYTGTTHINKKNLLKTKNWGYMISTSLPYTETIKVVINK